MIKLPLGFKEQNILIIRNLTEIGTEYCGKRDSHEYELYLALEDIEEQKHSFLKQMGYASGSIRPSKMSSMRQHIKELQKNVEKWMKKYNEDCPHSGKVLLWQNALGNF